MPADEVVRFWDAQASTFDDEPDHGLRDAHVRDAWRSLLLSVLPARPSTVVDLGCGTGSLTVLLAESGYDITGIDASLEQAAATLGATARARFRYILLPLLAQGLAINFCLSFVQTFSVFPSAVLLGAPAGDTRVISIAAYQAAYEQYDASMAAAIAMIMGFVQLAVVLLALAGRNLFYRGAAGGGKG